MSITLDGGSGFNPLKSFMLNGVEYDIGVRIYRWNESSGYNGYLTKRSVVKSISNKTGKKRTRVIKGPRYGKRRRMNPLKQPVDVITQLLVHHSGADRADPSVMYNVLYNERGLSCHFATEDDGRMWQFNDAVDRCWHAGKHNNMSVGNECCLYPLAEKHPRYYDEERRKRTGNLEHTVMEDIIHGRKMKVFCFTEPQINSLSKLYAGMWVAIGHQRRGGFSGAFDNPPLFPRDRSGGIPRGIIEKPRKHVGLIGHLQCTRRKIDPAGFPWENFEGLVGLHYNEFRENAGF